jgi:hypothetical protein
MIVLPEESQALLEVVHALEPLIRWVRSAIADQA